MVLIRMSKVFSHYLVNNHDQSQETHQDGKKVAEDCCHEEEENFSSKSRSGCGF